MFAKFLMIAMFAKLIHLVKFEAEKMSSNLVKFSKSYKKYLE